LFNEKPPSKRQEGIVQEYWVCYLLFGYFKPFGLFYDIAIGCQKVITEKIIEKKAECIIALKENQGDLFEQINEYLEKKRNCLILNRLTRSMAEEKKE
jgi:hypothetical protein